MSNVSLKSDITYFGKLLGAGWQGVTSAQTVDEHAAPVWTAALCTTAAVGAAAGMLSAYLRSRRSSSTIAMGGLIGSMVGLSSGVAWASRDRTEAAARNAVRRINTIRDARWLEKNPIAYA
jgi:ammonia channel protein AmtB